MQLVSINDSSDIYLPEIQLLYQDTFPIHERRNWQSLLQLLPNKKMHLQIILDEVEFIGLIVWWRLNKYLFIEHLAIITQKRGKKYGYKVMQVLLQKQLKLILETELPENDVACRRINFYKKIGLQQLPFSYMQPPYRKDESPVPMCLMSNVLLNKNEFDFITNIIRQEVYQANW